MYVAHLSVSTQAALLCSRSVKTNIAVQHHMQIALELDAMAKAAHKSVYMLKYMAFI